jgi:hypothetical protein
MKFSLRTLIAATTLAALACAALAKPSADWLTVVVSLTAIAFATQILRVLFQSGPSRAAAAGWLLFATAYLGLVFAPWSREHVGANLLSSQALLAAQPKVNAQQFDVDLSLTSFNGMVTYPFPYPININVNTNTSYALVQSLISEIPASVPPEVHYFHMSGHWLSAWLAGWTGALLAAGFHRRSHRSSRSA